MAKIKKWYNPASNGALKFEQDSETGTLRIGDAESFKDFTTGSKMTPQDIMDNTQDSDTVTRQIDTETKKVSFTAIGETPVDGANKDLSNLTTTGEAHFDNKIAAAVTTSEAYTDSQIATIDTGANKSLSNLDATGEAHFLKTVSGQAIMDATNDTASVTRALVGGKVEFTAAGSSGDVTSVNGKTGVVVLAAGDINTNVYSMSMASIPDSVITTTNAIDIPLPINEDNYVRSNLTGLVTWSTESFPGWASMQMAIADKADTTNRVTVAVCPESGAGTYPQATVDYVGDLSQFKGKEMVLVVDNAYAPFTIDFTGKNHLTIIHYFSEVGTETIQKGLDDLNEWLDEEKMEREESEESIRNQLSAVDRRTEMITSTGDGTKYLADDGTYKIVSSGGTSTDVQINGTSITSNDTANILTQSAYDAITNKIATVADIPVVPTVNIPWSPMNQMFNGGSRTLKLGEIQGNYTTVEFLYNIQGQQGASSGDARLHTISVSTDQNFQSVKGVLPADFNGIDHFYTYANADTGFIEIWCQMTGGFSRRRCLAYRTLSGTYVNNWVTADLPAEGCVEFVKKQGVLSLNTVTGNATLIAKNQSTQTESDNNPIGVDTDVATGTIGLGFTAANIIDNKTLKMDTDNRLIEIDDNLQARINTISLEGDGSTFLASDGQYHVPPTTSIPFYAPDYANGVIVQNGSGSWTANAACFVLISLKLQGDTTLSTPVITYATINDTVVAQVVLKGNETGGASYEDVLVPVLVGDIVSITLGSIPGGSTSGTVTKFLKRAGF